MKKVKKPYINPRRIKHKQVARKATITFSDRIAKRFHNCSYYSAMGFDMLHLQLRNKERERLRIRKKIIITKKLAYYNTLVDKKSEGMFNILDRIYQKNLKAAFEQGKVTNTNLLYIVSSVPMLVTAYKKIRPNKGLTTLGYIVSQDRYQNLSPIQKSITNKLYQLPDGLSKEIFVQTSQLLRRGLYPWGTSRRIYIDKPGKPDEKRPLTIPPFMDRVVQCSISMILQAIYEPYFEKNNNSFGFRPNKGVHDSIIALTNRGNNSLNMALEGDIKKAYDEVNRRKLIQILGNKIKDKKFLDLIQQRLDYQYYDSVKGEYVVEKNGIPQGGIDSPYLWNIYMLEFDNFVTSETSKYLEELNEKIPKKKVDRGEKTAYKPNESSQYRELQRTRRTLRFMVKVLDIYKEEHRKVYNMFYKPTERKKEEKISAPADLAYIKKLANKWNLDKLKKNDYKPNLTEIKYQIIKELNRYNHIFTRTPLTYPTHRILRFKYVRYADDWILITNAPRQSVEALKLKFQKFLQEELYATLSMDKTAITNMRKAPAHFLGFEIRCQVRPSIQWTCQTRNNKIKYIKTCTGGHKIFALPDRQRLINRLYMKGYCYKNGFPKEIAWLATLESFMIIERFNSVIRGLVNFYAEFVDSPERTLARWIYIIRYACLKTLAQKYKTTIGGIFKKFARNADPEPGTKSRTIAIIVRQLVDGEYYQKKWQLLTLTKAIELAFDIGRRKKVEDYYYQLESGSPVKYPFKQISFPSITQADFLDRIKWSNLRTQAALEIACCICGSTEKLEMHHLKHIRKRRYRLEDPTWLQNMQLRNRKQIAVCRDCHINLIHKGKYGGTKLSYFAPTVMFDGRLITIEAHVHKGRKDVDYTKTLEEKGWKPERKIKSHSTLYEQNQEQ